MLYGLLIVTRHNTHYMNFSHDLNVLIKDIKDFMADYEIDEPLPTKKEILDAIKQSTFNQFIRHFSDDSKVVIAPINKQVKAIIEIKKGSVQKVISNMPIEYYIKDMDDVDPEEWVIPHRQDSIVRGISKRIHVEAKRYKLE
jgi:hypothetical protein